ncbi:MAG: HNH endonuclease, partial [Gammaproteobacteria bacterium]|nr:HNH endonuclease [Gammaproteobacteria bacterium]
YICQLCGVKTRPDIKNQYHPKRPELDHIVPLSLGGEHTKQNTQCLCRQCNMTKNNTGVGDQLRLFG